MVELHMHLVESLYAELKATKILSLNFFENNKENLVHNLNPHNPTCINIENNRIHYFVDMFHCDDNVVLDMAIRFHNVNPYMLLYKHIYMVETKIMMLLEQEMTCTFHDENKLLNYSSTDQARILFTRLN